MLTGAQRVRHRATNTGTPSCILLQLYTSDILHDSKVVRCKTELPETCLQHNYNATHARFGFVYRAISEALARVGELQQHLGISLDGSLEHRDWSGEATMPSW